MLCLCITAAPCSVAAYALKLCIQLYFFRLLTPVSACADTRAWEVDTLRGHVNNVSCVMFHARQVSQSQADANCKAAPHK